jgi:hypothetical protein
VTSPTTDLLTACRATPGEPHRWLVYADELAAAGREGEAIATRIEAEPDEPRWRLDYASHLESVSTDPATLARCEVIRLAVELGRLAIEFQSEEICKGGCCVGRRALRSRRDALIREHSDAWRRGPKCEECGGFGERTWAVAAEDGGAIQETCPHCRSTGDAGGLMHREGDGRGRSGWLHRVDWETGFPRVHATLAECCAEEDCPDCQGPDVDPICVERACPTCNGTATRTVPSPWLRAVVAAHRGCEVVLTDREPFQAGSRRDQTPPGWMWSGAGANLATAPDIIPDALLSLLPPAAEDYRYFRVYPTPDAARLALARAVTMWGRVG